MMAPIGLSVRELVGSARFTCSPQCVMVGSHDDTDRTERKRRVLVKLGFAMCAEKVCPPCSVSRRVAHRSTHSRRS